MLRIAQELPLVPVKTVLPIGHHVGSAKEHGDSDHWRDTCPVDRHYALNWANGLDHGRILESD
jgi:hypothetical protein